MSLLSQFPASDTHSYIGAQSFRVAKQSRWLLVDADLVAVDPVLVHSFVSFAFFPKSQCVSMRNEIVERHPITTGFENQVDGQIDYLPRSMSWWEELDKV